MVSPFTSGLNSVPNLKISGHRSINKNSPLNRDNLLNRSPLNRDTTEVCKSVLPDGGGVKFISVMDSKLLASFDGFEGGHALDVTKARVLKVVHLTVGSERMLNLKILGSLLLSQNCKMTTYFVGQGCIVFFNGCHFLGYVHLF